MAARMRYSVCKQWICVANGRTVTQKVRRITPSHNHEALCTRRFFSNEPFNFIEIVRSNKESSSMDGVKRSMSKKVSQTTSKTSTKTEPSEAESEEDKSVPDDADAAEVPDWFTVLMDGSYTGDGLVDEEKFKQFYDFVEDLELKAIPSVGTILNRTRPKSGVAALERWRKSKTKELGGEEKFEQYQKKTLQRGVGFHKCVEKYLLGETDVEIDEAAKGYLESVQGVLKDVEDVKLVEKSVAHPEMLYMGKFDCIANYRGSPLLIEWKTSAVYKPMLSNTYDNPMQLAAYLGALNKSTILQHINDGKYIPLGNVRAWQ